MFAFALGAVVFGSSSIGSNSVGSSSIGQRTTWDPVTTPCPCNSSALCEPITRAASARENVYVMHGGFVSPHPGAPDDTYIWSKYDWGQVSTIAVFGTLSAVLLGSPGCDFLP